MGLDGIEDEPHGTHTCGALVLHPAGRCTCTVVARTRPRLVSTVVVIVVQRCTMGKFTGVSRFPVWARTCSGAGLETSPNQSVCGTYHSLGAVQCNSIVDQ